MTSRTLKIDAELCEGHGRCYSLCPEVFEDDERGYGVVRPDVDLDDPMILAASQSAIEVCPEAAISIVEQ